MPSHFPGMNPYLEARWSNIHVLMMGAITAALNRSLPPGLNARPEEEVRIESLAGERLQSYRGHVAVIDTGPRGRIGEPVTDATTAVAEPIRIKYHRGPIVLRNVQIVDSRDHDRIVTVIEVLSPWNKLPGRLNRDYRKKLRRYEEGEANWVEIDLLRSSRNRLPVTWDDLPVGRRAEYLVLTYRAATQEVLAYPISLRQALSGHRRAAARDRSGCEA